MKRILLTIQYDSIVIQYIGNTGLLRRPFIYGPPFLIRGAATSVSKREGANRKKVELKNVRPYQAAQQFYVVALKLHGKEEPGIRTLCTGLTHLLPGGGTGAALAAETLEPGI